MTMRPNTIFVLASLMNVWKLGKGVEILTCPSSSSIQIGSTTTTFQFGDGSTPYNTVLSCTWTITASDSSASLVIGQNLKCGDGDMLEITNVNSGAARQVTCCTDCTKPAVITGNTARITFTSDSTQRAEDIGFSLEIFAAKDESGCTSGNNNFSIPISSPYIITSPNFPGFYPNDIECRYTFTPVPPSLGLVISFQFINLDYDRGCYDYIVLKEGDINGNPIVKICQGYPVSSPVISPNETYRTKGSLFLHFSSEYMIPARGFRASVQQDLIFENTEGTTKLVNESTTKKNTTPTSKAESTTISTTDSRSTTSQSSIAKEITTNTSQLTTVTESNTRSTLPTTTEITTQFSSTTTSNVLKDATQSTTAQSATVSRTSKSTTSQISASTLTKGKTANNSSLTTVKESNTRSTLPTSTEILTRTSSITTSKVSGCSKTILNGNLINCHSRIGDTCRYECKGPLENNPSVPNITCNLNGFWNYDTNDLCLTLCKSEIKNGKLEFNCERKIGNKCSFVCEAGYISTIFSSNIVCTSDRIWNENIDELCKENGIEDDDGPYVYIGSTIAAIAVIILVVAIVWKFCLKQRNASGNNYQTSFVDREHIYMEIGNPGYSTGNNRSGMQEPVEYATIDDQSITGYEEPKSYKYTYSNAVFSS
ncbi:uncharacterized protein LOC134249578 isoform X2 [Saccostrea cucullata]|uniref:uncharacterized protein LOC134249578 isoform X2 n=1 Tax=Saccostrea cuccullata TaxID=36930 RepID=UPI002ED0AE57